MAEISNKCLIKTFSVDLTPYSIVVLCWVLGMEINMAPV